MEINIPAIPEFFSGKNIFITGATGFLGKALIEKFLRSSSDIGNIYILIRPKRGKDLMDRLKVLIDDPLFERAKEEQPTLKMEEKIIPLAGNMYELNLGLNEQDRKIITDNVNIIYHAAASVRFDDSLTDATILNIRGTREICQIALDSKNLLAYMHISTAYSNCDHFKIDEMLYPAKADWKKIIQIAEKLDKHILSATTQIYMNNMPNTYVFTKQIAEHVVNDMVGGKIPTKIFRPSIVNSSLNEPVKGWVDNFNGPIGLVIAYGKGIMKTCWVNDDVIPDYIPIDIVTKSLIVSTWDLAVRQNKSQTEIMHCSNNGKADWLKIDAECIRTLASYHSFHDLPLNNVLWPPCKNYATSKYAFYFQTVFYMLLPAVLVDAILKLTGRKPMLMKLVAKMYNVQIALVYFTQNHFHLINDKLFELQKKIKIEDIEKWDYEFIERNMSTYIYHCIWGSRKYLLKEFDDTLPQAKIHMRRMVIIKNVFWISVYILIGYMFVNFITNYYYGL